MNNIGSKEKRDDPTQLYFTANQWIRSFSQMITKPYLINPVDNIQITQDNLFAGEIFYKPPSIFNMTYITFLGTNASVTKNIYNTGSDILTENINSSYKIRKDSDKAIYFDFYIYKNDDLDKELHISLHPFLDPDSKIGRCHMTFGQLPVGGATGDVCDLWFRYNNDMIEILLTKCYQIFNYKIIYLIKNALYILSLKLNEELSKKLNRTNHLAPVYIHINDDLSNLINIIYIQYRKKNNTLLKFENKKDATIKLIIRYIKKQLGNNSSIIDNDNNIIILRLDNTLCDLATNAKKLIATYMSEIAELESNISSIDAEIKNLERRKNRIISDDRKSGDLYIEIEKTDKIKQDIEIINRDCLGYEAYIIENKRKKKLAEESNKNREKICQIPILLEGKNEELKRNEAEKKNFEKKAEELDLAIKECKMILKKTQNELTDSIEKVLITDLVDPMVFAVRKYILDKLIANDFELFSNYYNSIRDHASLRGGYRNKYLKYKAKYLALKKAFHIQE